MINGSQTLLGSVWGEKRVVQDNWMLQQGFLNPGQGRAGRSRGAGAVPASSCRGSLGDSQNTLISLLT